MRNDHKFIIEFGAECRELGLTFIINRDSDKHYEFCKGTRVIWSVQTPAEARRFLQACKINRSHIAAL